MRVVLVGAGSWGLHVLDALQTNEATELVAVVEPDAERARRAGSLVEVPVVPTIDQLFMPYDSAAICTPVITHGELAIQLLEAGKHVWVEKPLATDRTQARRIAHAASMTNSTVFVDHLMVYAPGIRELTRHLGSASFPWTMHCERSNMGVVRREEDVVWSLGPHDVAIAIRLFGGKPMTVSCTGHAVVSDRADIAAAQMSWGTKGMATMRWSWLDPWKTRSVSVTCPDMALRYDDTAHALVRWPVGWVGGQPVLGRPEQTILTASPLDEAVSAFAVAPALGSWSDGYAGIQVVDVLTALSESFDKGGTEVLV